MAVSRPNEFSGQKSLRSGRVYTITGCIGQKLKKINDGKILYLGSDRKKIKTPKVKNQKNCRFSMMYLVVYIKKIWRVCERVFPRCLKSFFSFGLIWVLPGPL